MAAHGGWDCSQNRVVLWHAAACCGIVACCPVELVLQSRDGQQLSPEAKCTAPAMERSWRLGLMCFLISFMRYPIVISDSFLQKR